MRAEVGAGTVATFLLEGATKIDGRGTHAVCQAP